MPVVRSGNYTGYCNPELDKLVDQQSIEADQEKRKKLVWEIERKLAEDVARPIIFHIRAGDLLAALCQGGHDRWSTAATTDAHGGRLAGQVGFVENRPVSVAPEVPL